MSKRRVGFRGRSIGSLDTEPMRWWISTLLLLLAAGSIGCSKCNSEPSFNGSEYARATGSSSPGTQKVEEEPSSSTCLDSHYRYLNKIGAERCSWVHGPPGCSEGSLCVDLAVRVQDEGFVYPSNFCYRECDGATSCHGDMECRRFLFRIPPMSEFMHREFFLCVPSCG